MAPCAAYGCTNKKTKNLSGVSYHQFPRDEALKKCWIKAIGRKDWQPIKSSFLCSDHFNPKDIKRISCFQTVLRKGAVPCIFKEWPSDPQGKTTNLSRGAESDEPYENLFAAKLFDDDDDDDDADSPLSTPTVTDFFPVLSSDSDTSQSCTTSSPNHPTIMFPKIGSKRHLKVLSAGVHMDSISSATELSQAPVTANLSCSASSVTPSSNCVPLPQVLDSSSIIHYSHVFYKASFERKIRNMKFENFEAQREVRKLQTRRRKLQKELDKVFSVIVSLHRSGCFKTGLFEKMETDYKLHAGRPELDVYELTKL